MSKTGESRPVLASEGGASAVPLVMAIFPRRVAVGGRVAGDPSGG
ncbi:hypothetical protein [Meridianimarinicoccus aquatilis]|nr:hypothetical protein [Fluviibacterium aquatile]